MTIMEPAKKWYVLTMESLPHSCRRAKWFTLCKCVGSPQESLDPHITPKRSKKMFLHVRLSDTQLLCSSPVFLPGFSHHFLDLLRCFCDGEPSGFCLMAPNLLCWKKSGPSSKQPRNELQSQAWSHGIPW